MLDAVDAGRVSLEVDTRRSEVQRSPAAPALALVIPRRAALAGTTPAMPLSTRTHAHHDDLLVFVVLDLLDDSIDPQHAPP